MRIASLALLSSGLLTAQFAPPIAPPPPPPPGPPTWAATSPVGAPTVFEVATIRPNTSYDAPRMTPSAGRLSLTNYSLTSIIKWAWNLRDYQLIGAPGWIDSAHFDVEAKPYGAPDLGHLQLLMRPLLQERFGMEVHTETRTMPIFELKVQPRGSRLRRAAPNSLPRLSFAGTPVFGRISGEHESVAHLTRTLSFLLQRPVIDRTALAGDFDFEMQWLEQDSFFTAIKEQLGLRLESAKGPGEVLVIDRISKLSEN